MSNQIENTRFKRRWKNFYKFLLELNGYIDADTMLEQNQIKATRIYLCLFILALSILALFNGLNEQTYLVTINHPQVDIFEELSTKYPHTLTCPCSQTSILHSKFLSFSPRYHSVCSSKLVDIEWISTLFPVISLNAYHPLDFRLSASTQFQGLAFLCQLSQSVVTNTSEQFLSTTMISNEVLFPWNFDTRMNAIIEQFQRDTLTTISIIDRFVSQSIFNNRLISALRTNHLAYLRAIPGNMGYFTYFALYPKSLNTSNYYENPTSARSCSCHDFSQCFTEVAIFSSYSRCSSSFPYWPCTIPNFFVAGMKIGCFLMDALFQSTLECFYDSNCYRQILSLIGGLTNDLSPLIDVTNSSRFHSKSLIGDMFAELFIESWQNTSNFNDYYNACAPAVCTFSYISTFNFVYILIALFGMIGGLNVALYFFSPYILRIINQLLIHIPRRKVTNVKDIEQQKPNMQQQLIHIWKRLSQKFIRLNIYKNSIMDDTSGIYATRLFFLLFLCGLIILTVRVSTTSQTQSRIIYTPTLVEIEALYKRYPLTLSCPCQKTMFDYSSIMNIQPRYHQICSSVFIDSNGWLAYFRFTWQPTPDSVAYRIKIRDFRVLGFAMFSMLSTLCNGISDLVIKEMQEFNRTQFFTQQALAREEFLVRTNIIMDRFSRKVVTNFVTMHKLFDIQVRRNEFLLTEFNNIKWNTYQENDAWAVRFSMNRFSTENGSCSCGESDACPRRQGFYNRGTFFEGALPTIIVPDLFYGCYPIDSVLLSTLACFYNQSCIDMLLENREYDTGGFVNTVTMVPIVALDPKLLNSFSPTTRLSEVVDRAFVEQWIKNASIDAYHRQCQPKFCIYTWIGTYPLILIIVTVIGLGGGLKVIMTLLAPIILKIVTMILRYRTNQSELSTFPQRQVEPLSWIHRLLYYIISMNMYKRRVPRQDAILATRIYLVLLILSLFLIGLFIKVNDQTLSFTVQMPSRDQIDLLHLKYSSTLICPCSRTSVRYGTFYQIEAVYHTICLDFFIDMRWITHIFRYGEEHVFIEWEWLSAMFHYLRSMCDVSKFIVKQSISNFLNDEMITSAVISEEEFQSHLVLAIHHLINDIRISFQRINVIITEKLRLNRIQDRHMTSWRMVPTNISYDYRMDVVPVVRHYDRCICAAGHTACSWSMIWRGYATEPYIFPGLFGGCTLVSGFRQSTLECWFNQSCIDTVLKMVNSSAIVRVMNVSISNRFPPITTQIGTLVDELFIESWQNLSNYTNYFNACAPLTCQYSQTRKNDIVYVFSVLLGFYGGLTVMWRLLAWYLVRLGRWIVVKCRIRVIPIQSISIAT